MSNWDNFSDFKPVPSKKLRRVVAVLTLLLFTASLGWVGFVLFALQPVAIARLSEITQTRVESSSVRLALDGSVVVRDLVMRQIDRADADDYLIKADRAAVRFSLLSLLSMKPSLKEIVIEDFQLNVVYDQDAELWNIRYEPPEPPTKPTRAFIPRVKLSRGLVRLSTHSSEKSEQLIELGLDFTLTPKTPQSHSFDLTTVAPGRPQGTELSGTISPGKLNAAGVVASDDIPFITREFTMAGFDIDARFDAHGKYDLSLNITDLDIAKPPADEIVPWRRGWDGHDRSPESRTERIFNEYRFWGRGDVSLAVSGDLAGPDRPRYNGIAYCKDVSLLYSDFPYQLENVVGIVNFTTDSLIIDNLYGRHDQVDVGITARVKHADRSLRVRLTSNNLVIDQALLDAMHPSTAAAVRMFNPKGKAAFDCLITRQPGQQRRSMQMEVDLLGVDAAFEKFPWPLKNTTGKIVMDSDDLYIEQLRSDGPEGSVTASGVVRSYTENADFDIDIRAQDLHIDDTLVRVLSPEHQDAFSQLELAGLLEADVKVFNTADDPEPTFAADLLLKQGTLGSGLLDIRLLEAQGTASLTGGKLQLHDITGTIAGDPARVHGSVNLLRTDPNQPYYTIAAEVAQAQLREELFNILPGDLAQTIAGLNAKGAIGYRAKIIGSENRQQDFEIAIDCLENSIHPRQLPWPLESIAGRITVGPDKIGFSNVRAQIGSQNNPQSPPTTVLSGDISLKDNGFDQGRFVVKVNNFPIDKSLAQLLGDDAARTYRDISPKGLLNTERLIVSLQRPQGHEPNSPGQITLKGPLAISDGQIDTELGITDFTAAVELDNLTYATGPGLTALSANLGQGRLKIADKLLTGASAQLGYDPNNSQISLRNVVADFYGGKITGRLDLHSAAEPMNYNLQAAFDNVNVNQLLTPADKPPAPAATSTRGRMSGSLSVQQSDTRTGRCRIHVTDMQAGRLPFLAKLLQLQSSDDYAFDQLVMDSYLRGSRLMITQADISGQDMALNGTGWIDIDQHTIDMLLYSRGRRLSRDEPSIWQALAEGLGQGVVRVEVTGNWQNPAIRTRTLPLIRESLGILGTRP